MDKTKTWKMKQKNKKILFWSLGIVLILSVAGGLIWAFMPGSILNPDEEEEADVLLVSTFTFYSAQDGEDVSPFAEVDIWKPKSAATFDELYKDITDLTTNFERTVTGKDADDVSIDLRDEPYYWLEITGNSVFNNTFHLLPGGTNYNYIKYIHDTTTDVNFAILNSTGGAITIPGQATADNYTGVLKAPHYTTTADQVHYGDNWAMSTTDFADLSATAQKVYWNEMYWADQYPTYNPELDTSNDYFYDFEKLTNTFALKFTFNDTINSTDGAVTEINCTMGDDYPIEVWTDAANLYMAWDEGISFDPDYTFTFEMWFGANITVTTVESGRANVFGDLSSIAWSETYSTIGT